LNRVLGRGNQAEVAVLVSDPCQGQGVGLEPLRRVVQVARDEKLSRVPAEMLADNLAIQVISKKLGFQLRPRSDSSSVHAVLDP
jgi:acetyltransferase